MGSSALRRPDGGVPQGRGIPCALLLTLHTPLDSLSAGVPSGRSASFGLLFTIVCRPCDARRLDGSHAQWFLLIHQLKIGKKRETVPKALQAIGLCGARRSLEKSDKFVDLFDFQPRPLQAAIDLDPADPATQLIIAESETGSGKTEALVVLQTLSCRSSRQPLRLTYHVAARSIYQRVRQSMERWFPIHLPSDHCTCHKDTSGRRLLTTAATS